MRLGMVAGIALLVGGYVAGRIGEIQVGVFLKTRRHERTGEYSYTLGSSFRSGESSIYLLSGVQPQGEPIAASKCKE